jgi:hypothetical protein
MVRAAPRRPSCWLYLGGQATVTFSNLLVLGLAVFRGIPSASPIRAPFRFPYPAIQNAAAAVCLAAARLKNVFNAPNKARIYLTGQIKLLKNRDLLSIRWILSNKELN